VSMDVLDRIASSSVIPMQAVPKPGSDGGPVSKGVWDGVRGHSKATVVDSPESTHSDSEATALGPGPPPMFAEDDTLGYADRIGARVWVKGYDMDGTLLFVGAHRTQGGLRCGVTLDKPVGHHDGMVEGERYFQCGENHGVLVPTHQVVFADDRGAIPVDGGAPTRKVTRRVKERSVLSLRKSEIGEENGEAAGPLTGQLATATWSFDARNEDEVALQVGSRVELLETPGGGWWRGRVEEGSVVSEGWFPANHVNIDSEVAKTEHRPRSFFSLHVDSYTELDEDVEDLAPLPPHAEPSGATALDDGLGAAPTGSTKTVSKKRSVLATHRYEAQNEDELTFETGETIQVLQSPSGGWWEGTLERSGKSGWFPTNHVTSAKSDDPITDDPATDLIRHIDRYGWKQHTALSDFSSLSDGQVELIKGDIVVIMQEGDAAKKGWCEVLCRGQHGWVPRPFLSAEPTKSNDPAHVEAAPLDSPFETSARDSLEC
jgi:hypothetical protein